AGEAPAGAAVPLAAGVVSDTAAANGLKSVHLITSRTGKSPSFTCTVSSDRSKLGNQYFPATFSRYVSNVVNGICANFTSPNSFTHFPYVFTTSKYFVSTQTIPSRYECARSTLFGVTLKIYVSISSIFSVPIYFRSYFATCDEFIGNCGIRSNSFTSSGCNANACSVDCGCSSILFTTRPSGIRV